MTESSRLTVLDFIISVLTRHEKELDKVLAKLQHIARRLEERTMEQPRD